jgi:hypothetical protein
MPFYSDPFFFSEAKIRFLKARLRVMQEELERMHTECVKRVSDA